MGFIFNPFTSKLDFVGSRGLGLIKPVSGAVNGSNDTYIWSVEPVVICVDNGSMMTQINTDDVGVNWTGTTTTIMTVAPNSDIFGFG